MIQMLTSVIGQRGVDAMAFLLAFVLTALTDSIFRDKLPHDHGRAFAVNGELSKGKARGSGLIFVLCIALVSLAFLPSPPSMWCIMCCSSPLCSPAIWTMPPRLRGTSTKRASLILLLQCWRASPT